VILMKIESLFLVLVAGMINVIAEADDFSRSEIRQLVSEGVILPLDTILKKYPEQEYGKLLDLEVEKEHGNIVYELEFLRVDGRVLELEIDASDGHILEKEINH